MKRFALLSLLALAACKQETTVTTGTVPMDSREPIAIRDRKAHV